MAQLVVQRHADIAEHGAAEPGAIERIAARRHVPGLCANGGQRAAQRGDAFLRHQVHDRIRIGGVEAFGRMRDGVDAARHAHADRQAHREFWVVDHGARQHLEVLAGLLHAGLGDAVDRRHLGARVGGRNGQDRQARVERNGLAQSGGRTAADGHGAVGAQALRHRAGFTRRLDGHVHHRAVEHAGRVRAQHVGDALGLRALLGRGQHQGAPRAQRVDLARQVLQRPGTEHHPLGNAVVNEGL